MKKAFMIIGTIILGIVGIFGLVLGIIKNSDAYKILEKEILTNKSIASEYGNVDIGFLPMGSIEVSGSEGNANLQVGINGNGKDGTVFTNLIKKNNQWTITDFKFTNNKNKKMQNQEFNQDKDSFTEEDDSFWLRYNIPGPKDNTLDHLNQENQEYIQNSLGSKMQIIGTGKGYFRMKADFYGVEISVPAQRKNYGGFTKYETLHIYPSNDTGEYVPKNDITIKFLKNGFLDERKNGGGSAFEQSYNEAEKELTNMYEGYKEKFGSGNAETYRLSFEKDEENNQIRYSLRNIISPYISGANSMYVIFIKNPDKTSNQWINIAYIGEDKNFDSYTKLLKKMIESIKIDRNHNTPSEQYLIENKLIGGDTHMLGADQNFEKEKELAMQNSQKQLTITHNKYILYYIKDENKRFSQIIYRYDLEGPLSSYYFDPIANKELSKSKPAPRSSEEIKNQREDEYADKRRIKNKGEKIEEGFYKEETQENNINTPNQEKEKLLQIKKRYMDHTIAEDEANKIINNIETSVSQLEGKQRTEIINNILKQLK